MLSVSSALPSFLPPFFLSFLPSYFLPISLPSFLHSFIHSFLPFFLASLLPSFLPFYRFSFIPFSVHSILCWGNHRSTLKGNPLWVGGWMWWRSVLGEEETHFSSACNVDLSSSLAHGNWTASSFNRRYFAFNNWKQEISWRSQGLCAHPIFLLRLRLYG